MKNLPGLVFLLLIYASGYSQGTTRLAVFSQFVKDTFDLTVTINPGNSLIEYSSVYYLDADLESGKRLRELIKTQPRLSNEIIFIGIANRGRTKHRFRKRDYIPPLLKNNNTLKNVPGRSQHFGHADVFYKFLTMELIPFIESKYLIRKRSLIGHSLGGLFVMYSLFQKDHVFNNYITLSPALWANKFNILKYEQQYFKQNIPFNNYLFISAGTKEIFNKILDGNRYIKNKLQRRNYKGLQLEYKEWKKETHDSEVQVSLEYLLGNRILN